MTTQTAQMLRKSVVAVAGRKAQEQQGGDSQEDLDRKYLHAFFGKDFIDELKTMDSEVEITALTARLANARKSNQIDLVSVVKDYKQLRDLVSAGLVENSPLADVARLLFGAVDQEVESFAKAGSDFEAARNRASKARTPLDYKRFLDIQVDETEDKYIEQLEGTRSHCANIDNYIKRISTALDDDFNRQFYNPAFRSVRCASRSWDVNVAQVETTTVLTNNRQLGKVDPAATFEFDLPKREIFITEAMKGAKAAMDDYGALLNDPTFLALVKMRSGQPVSSLVGGTLGDASVRSVLPGLPTTTDEMIMAQQAPGRRELGSQLENLIPDPSVYKFETGTGYEIRPVISPDGQSVVFNFNYMYSTKIREPVRADAGWTGTSSTRTCNWAITNCGKSANTPWG
ncbi:hypothetical protein [Zavarzinella formosa]|uniref:hypothetical protein n=1 Tax=Zavarzinella formosa TaxID=360055 RepID=UPI0012FB6954|nr:hypothetical protein [Zavarzinella formosa]